jgi:transposase
MRILVAVAAVDFRKGIDGLAQICREAFSADPFSGAVFVFRNQRRTAVKILVYDGQGYWLCHKRLSEGRYRWWPSAKENVETLEVAQLQVLLSGGNPELARAAPEWRKISMGG